LTSGLGGDVTLSAGQRPAVPAKVTNLHNTAQTFKPYDPGAAIGDLSPTTPNPPPPALGKHGCRPVVVVDMNVYIRNISGRRPGCR